MGSWRFSEILACQQRLSASNGLAQQPLFLHWPLPLKSAKFSRRLWRLARHSNLRQRTLHLLASSQKNKKRTLSRALDFQMLQKMLKCANRFPRQQKKSVFQGRHTVCAMEWSFSVICRAAQTVFLSFTLHSRESLERWWKKDNCHPFWTVYAMGVSC